MGLASKASVTDLFPRLVLVSSIQYYLLCFSYERQERKYLLQKIGIALFGPPKIEGNLTEGGDQLKLKGYEKREEELTMTVFEKICEQGKPAAVMAS